MKLIGYLRVSTDDKGQDPERQRPVLVQGAARDGNEVVAWVIDQSPAGEKAMPTFDRPKIKEAFALAREHGAGGLIVENVDRWTRKGADDLGYSHFVMRRDYGLKLWFADLAGMDDFAREVLPPLMATLARLDNKRRSDQAKTSAAKRIAEGKRIGREPKDVLSDEEAALLDELRATGAGAYRLANALSRHRRFHEVADEQAQRERKLSDWWVRTHYLANRCVGVHRCEESPGVSSHPVRQGRDPVRGEGPISSGVPA